VPSSGGMVRRVVGVAVALVVVGGLGLALASGRRPSYSSVEALGHDIHAHGIGCPRLYSAYQAGGPRVGVDAATCLVGSATVTLYVYKDVALYVYKDVAVLERRGEPTYRSYVVGPNWMVVTRSRPAALQVTLAIGGDLIPEEVP
jgi:hypothetical protein